MSDVASLMSMFNRHSKFTVLIAPALILLVLSSSSSRVPAQCKAHPEGLVRPEQTDPITLSPNVTSKTPDIIALTTDNKLLRFNSSDPTKILSELTISPINLHGESLVAIDYNPLGGSLYGLGSAGTLFRIYENGVPVGGSQPSGFTNHGTKVGLDFDPKATMKVDLPLESLNNFARVVTDAGQNQLMVPDGGSIGNAQSLAYAASDVNAGRRPNVVGLAYSNNFAHADSATAYAIDSELGALVRLGSIDGVSIAPDSGQLFTVGSLGVNTTNFVGFDIASENNLAYASLTAPGEGVSKLYTINLTTGAATPLGVIGGGKAILDIAVAPSGTLTLVTPPLSWCWTGYAAFKESDGHIIFMITRTGNTSIGSTVDYVLDQSRSTVKEGTNVIGTFGRVYFAPGEVSKSFSVFLIDDANSQGVRRLAINLARPTGDFFVTNEDGFWSIDITDNDQNPSSTNPIDQSLFFVREHYIDFLQREPDSSGLQFWQNQLNSCGADQQCLERQKINVSASFFLSIEFQQTGFLVYSFYKAAFGRMPQLNEFQPDKQVMGQDLVVNSPGWEHQLEQNKVAFADLWIDRPDFKNLYDDKTNSQYVDALIANTGAAFSAAERDALINGLNSNTETRATVLRKIAENQTFTQQEFNRAFVLMEYFGYLRRNPNDAPDSDYSGYNFWLNKLNAFNGDFAKAEMVKAFVNSTEYRQRFGP